MAGLVTLSRVNGAAGMIIAALLVAGLYAGQEILIRSR